jgi:hypothetical protein
MYSLASVGRNGSWGTGLQGHDAIRQRPDVMARLSKLTTISTSNGIRLLPLEDANAPG